MKRLSFRYKIIFINGIALILVIVTGIFAYQRFTGVIAQMSESSAFNNRLLNVKSILGNMSEAESHVKSFSITKDTTYLRKYYITVIECQMKWSIHSETGARSGEEQKLTDSLGNLLYSKFDVLNEILILQDAFRVREALDKVIYDIETSVQSSIDNDTKKANENKKKRKFLSGLFRKRSKEGKATEITPSINQEKITLLRVGDHVEKVKEEEEAIEDSLRTKELALINSDKAINDKIIAIVNRLEYIEDSFQHDQTVKTRESLKNTNWQIALFCIAVGILLLIVTHTIIRYVSYSNKYRKALRKAKEETEELALAKDIFFRNISHEIRTPMNAISGFADLIGEGPLTGSQREQLGMLQKSAGHLLYLINDVLDLSKLDAGKLRLEAIAFHGHEVLTEIRDLMLPIAAENETQLVLNLKNIPPNEDIFIGDPYRLKQILLNVVGNAIKFTKKGSVTLTSDFEVQSDKVKFSIEVKDTGIGMSKLQLNRVFQEFEQADASISRTYGGSGLGLSIVYKLVKLHGGEIEIKSKQGDGTSVFITLYYKKGNLENILKKKDETALAIGLPQHLKILVVDDEIYNRKLLVAILKKYDANCVEAENGMMALKEVKRNDFDVILMDNRMPRMSGVEATMKIRKMESSKKDIPVIALTAAISDLEHKEYQDAGMQAFLPKPFKERELIETISRVLTKGSYVSPETLNDSIVSEAEEHFDLTELQKLSRGDRQFYKEMVTMFIESTSKGLNDIRMNLDSNNWQKVADYAHKISAPCRHVGANILYKQIKDIETFSRDESKIGSVGELFLSACKEFECIEIEFKKELLK